MTNMNNLLVFEYNNVTEHKQIINNGIFLKYFDE